MNWNLATTAVNFVLLAAIAYELYQLVFVAYPLQLQYYKECSVRVLCEVGEIRADECRKYYGNLGKLINTTNGTDILIPPAAPFWWWSK